MDKIQQEIYDDLFKNAMDLIVKHMDNPHVNQLVSGTMLAIAIRFYKSALTDEDFEKFLNSIAEVGKDAKPFSVVEILPKRKLN
jgi:mannose/fructose-specific phosphotransferase system component IIA